LASIAAASAGCLPLPVSSPQSGNAAQTPDATVSAAPLARGERQIVGKVLATASARSVKAALSGESGLPQSLVYLIRQDDTFYEKDGKVVFALTDAEGRFGFLDVPAEPLLVSVVLPGNRRLTGLVRPVDGENVLEVGVATTYMAAFLRNRAAAAGKPLDRYASTFNLLPKLADMTGALITRGGLPAEPDLAVDAAPRLARAYAVALASRDANLAAEWKGLLGKATPAIETLASPSLPEGAILSVASAPDGTVFAGEWGREANRLTRLAASGSVPVLAGMWGSVRDLGYPASLLFDPGGVLFFGDGYTGYVRRFRPEKLKTGEASRVPPEGDWTIADDEMPVVPTQAFREAHPRARDISPRGASLAPDGTLYLADARNHRILAVAPLLAGESFRRARRVAGLPPAPQFDSDLLAGYSGDGGPATQAALAHPNGVMWRSEGASGSLYIADTDNHRIRRVNLATGIISTVAGSGPGFDRDNPPPGGFGGDGGAAVSARFKYPMRVAFLPDGGLLIADSGNQRVRVVERDGTIGTLAGGDPTAAGATAVDGAADQTVLGDVRDLAVDASGDVVVAAFDRGIRKLWLHSGR
jgi:hypothetical protein